ncbi:unnamed protein product [Leptidea sinapis]|uniref:Uncharacterized protein n=1 Tax=Leptidea sinapis TaxID=189913 RepID=A0A5E4QMH3_9NEOP|nr:unnamed protein product [Leptidea sinapis]
MYLCSGFLGSLDSGADRVLLLMNTSSVLSHNSLCFFNFLLVFIFGTIHTQHWSGDIADDKMICLSLYALIASASLLACVPEIVGMAMICMSILAAVLAAGCISCSPLLIDRGSLNIGPGTAAAYDLLVIPEPDKRCRSGHLCAYLYPRPIQPQVLLSCSLFGAGATMISGSGSNSKAIGSCVVVVVEGVELIIEKN